MDGRVQTRNYEGQDGKRVYVTEIVAESVQFLEPKGSGGSGNASRPNPNQNQGYGSSPNFGYDQNQQRSNNNNQGYTRVDDDPFKNDGQPIDISDDDLPF